MSLNEVGGLKHRDEFIWNISLDLQVYESFMCWIEWESIDAFDK